MIKLLFIFATSCLLYGHSFNKTEKLTTRYAYVRHIEMDKTAEGNDRFVHVVSDVVPFTCEIGENNIEQQFMKHYDAFEKTKTRDIAAIGECSAWIYRSQDEALSKRREYLASVNYRKRIISNFYISCK